MESVSLSIDLATLFHPDTIRLSRLAERLDDGPHHGGRIDPFALVVAQREEATGQAGIDRYPMLQLAVGRAGDAGRAGRPRPAPSARMLVS